ncbi:MAG: ATP-binding cassette domain-containing protein [Gemmatimonadales bacterium]|jgi:putative ABC transport system ATP-binding protein
MSTLPDVAFRLRDVRQAKSGRVLLRDIDLLIPRGQITVLLGSSGAGKTSLLRLLNRLDDPEAGEISYLGRALVDYPVTELRQRVGFVFQTPTMFAGSVHDNLREAAEIAGLEDRDFPHRAREALELAGLDPALEARPSHELSVGEQQRATLARTLIGGPEVLLLDEPTSALDPESSEFLLASIRRLRTERGITVVLSTHRHDEAAAIADEAVRLSEGAVEESGEAADVLA